METAYNTGDISQQAQYQVRPIPTRPRAPTSTSTPAITVHQKAYWDASGANAKAEKYSKAEGGNANSNGDQAPRAAMTSPTWMPTRRPIRKTDFERDQSQDVMAGIGGDGGDDNKAEGGDVDVKASIESANLNYVSTATSTTISTIQA